MAKKGKLHAMADSMEKATKAQEAEVARIIKANAKVLLDMNKQQLMQGIDSKGKSLGEYASEWYARMKRTLNPRGVVDLRLLGHFYNKFFLKVETKNSIVIDSRDPKRDKLVNDYGSDIFGITQENKRAFGYGYIREGLLKYYRKALHVR